MFETAFEEVTHPDTHGRKEVVQTHRLGSLMKDPLTGRYEPVMLTVLEYAKHGNRIYTVEAVDVMKYRTPAGQLVDSALPAITPRLQELVRKVSQRAEKVNGGSEINYLRDTAGNTLGWFDPKAKEVHLLPGADPQTVAKDAPKTEEERIEERLDLKRLDPKRRSDPKVLEWAKKQGSTVTDGMVTPDAVREYDEHMTE